MNRIMIIGYTVTPVRMARYTYIYIYTNNYMYIYIYACIAKCKYIYIYVYLKHSQTFQAGTCRVETLHLYRLVRSGESMSEDERLLFPLLS